MKTRIAILSACFVISAALQADAQLAAAAVHGTISAIGPDGQPFTIPGVTVQLARTPPAAEPATLFSNEVGEYTFTDLTPGTYTVEASLQGFATTRKPITVPPGQAIVVDFRLELAGIRSGRPSPRQKSSSRRLSTCRSPLSSSTARYRWSQVWCAGPMAC